MFVETKETPVTAPLVTPKWQPLIEAIERGMLLYPRQCFGPLYETDALGPKACLIGTAIGGDYDKGLDYPEGHCPEKCGFDSLKPLQNPDNWRLLAHLGDNHGWSRRHAIEWLKTLG